MASAAYAKSVFINCPFDTDYAPLFDVLVFTVHDCDCTARCALEIEDSSRSRIDKIVELIADCRLGVHNLSRTESDAASGLPRFNMPLELGLFLGAKRYGNRRQREKNCLVLDREKYRYQKFCSDIAGQDVSAHNGKIEDLVRIVRDWLRNAQLQTNVMLPSGSVIFERYHQFQAALPRLCERLRLDRSQLLFRDRVVLIVEWLKENGSLSASRQ